MKQISRVALVCAGGILAVMTTGPTAARADSRDDGEKTAVYPVVVQGDCELIEARITVRPDGTGTWRSTTLTRRAGTGQLWRSTLDFRTGSETALFSRGPFESPEMRDGNPPPRVEAIHRFTFEPSRYDSIDLTKTHLWSECRPAAGTQTEEGGQ